MTKSDSQMKEDRLAEALRANLRRRKAPKDKVSEGGSAKNEKPE